MVVIYVRRINEGLMAIDEVPVRWKDATIAKLSEQTVA